MVEQNGEGAPRHGNGSGRKRVLWRRGAIPKTSKPLWALELEKLNGYILSALIYT